MRGKRISKIVLSGLAGSGKSTIGRLLEEKLGWKFISMGDFSRNYALENFNMDINTFQDYCKRNLGVDELLDRQFIQYCKAEENLIIDYRLGFHFVKDAFTVCLFVSPQEAAKRIQLAGRSDETPESIALRNIKMIERFKETYEIDFSDSRYYHLVIGTDFLSKEQILNRIIGQVII